MARSFIFTVFIASILALTVFNCDVSATTTSSITISEATIGENATVQCTLNKDQADIVNRMAIGKVEGSTDIGIFNIFLNNPVTFTTAAGKLPKHSFDPTTLTMTISDLECTDEVEYYCTSQVFFNGGEREARDSKSLVLKVPPTVPTLQSTVPASFGNGVAEGSNVGATCQANVGRPDKGRIVWKVYKGGVREDIPTSDSRVQETQRTISGDPSCTRRLDSTLTLPSVNRSSQDLVLACFIVNDDYQPTAPTSCDNSDADYCQKTQTLKILYGVSDIFVAPSSTDQLYEEGSVTLTCRAQGLPLPTYTWTKTGDENATLSPVMDGETSKLTLTSLNIQEDAGQYNCSATNNVLGTEYSASSSILINILPTTTSAPTTPSTAPTSTEDPGTQTEGSTQKSDDTDTIIIAVVVSLVVVLIIAIIVGVLIYKRRQPKKEIEEPSEKPYNNRSNLSFQGQQPDLVSDEKKFNNPNLNNSFDYKNEDGLMYADMTYDNRPRSRKPMAIGDAASDYSSVEMPQV